MGGYDQSGNLLKWNLEDPHGIVYNSYVYDALNQLIEETGNASHSYQCDALSNRMKMDENAYEVNRLNQITQQIETNYQYDLNGNRINKTTPTGKVTYQYDALNRLIQVSTNDSMISYAYDTFNRRISRTDDDKTTYFLYREMEEIGSYVNNRVEDLKILGEPHCVAIEIQDKHYATIVDHFGNIAALICPNTGETITTYRFGAFGEETHFGDVHSPWRYQQKRHDPFTNLIYFGYRDYDKEIGTWSTPDPLGFADGPNLYAYVHHNPIMLHDPEGTFSLPSFNTSHRSEGNINNSNQFLWREHKPAEVAKPGAFRSLYRGFVDDTTWGLSDWALGEHESGSWGNRVCYGIGTGASLAIGLFYGSTEAKIGYGALKASRWIGGKVFQGGKYLWRGASHRATNFFKPATVINSTGVYAKSTQSTVRASQTVFTEGYKHSFTKSTLQIGQKMHKTYKMDMIGLKEYRLMSGRRVDFVDHINGVLYELKPHNQKSIRLGYKQLELYKQDICLDPRFKNIRNWKTVLETY